MSEKLDQFHWHEALHTTHLFMEMIDSHLGSHPTHAELGEEDQKHLSDAIDSLYKYYNACCQKQDDVER